MDEGCLSPTSTPTIHLSKPSGGPTPTGLTLLIPSLRSLKAAKKFKDPPTPTSISNANSNLGPFFQDVNVVDSSTQEKKIARPVKLKPLKEVLMKLIAQIKKKDDYAFFLHPVNSQKVPGYADVVKRPMDLGTISHKVNKGKYRSLEDFANDFKLVTTNAKLFNPPGSIYYIEADRIEIWGLEHIAKAAGTVIQYETDWNIEIEKEDEDEVNVDVNENEEDEMDVDERRDRSVSVLSQQQNQQQQAQAGPSVRRGTRAPYKRQGPGAAGPRISETLEQDGGLPGSKDGLGVFPPGSDWAKTVLALKLKKKRYKTKKERLRMERDGPPLLPDGSLDYTEMEDPFSVLSFFVPEPQTRPHLVPLYPPLRSLPPLTPISTSISTSSDAPRASSYPLTRAFPSTTTLPLDYIPATLPFLRNVNSNQQPTEKKKPFTAPTSRRRHWTITRNTTSRQKGKEKEDDHLESVGVGGGFGVEVPAWQVAREAHAVDFGCFAPLEAEMEAEMRRRGLGVGVNGMNGIEGIVGVNEMTGRVMDNEDREQDAMLELIRSSLYYSQAVRNVGGGEGDGEDSLNAGAIAATPTPSSKIPRTGASSLANAYWTTQRAAEAEDYIRDVVYGGVDGLAYVRSLAEFVGDSCLYRDSDTPTVERDSKAYIYNSELGMSLAKWVEVNIVDPLTQGRHSLIRQTALELVRLRNDPVSSPDNPTLSSDSNFSSSTPKQSLHSHLSNLPTDPRTGTISTQILASLHFYPSLLLALSSLVHIRMQKIDMGSLIKTPDELFVSEEEWVGKGIKEKKAKAKNDGMDVDVHELTRTGVDNKGIPSKAVKEEEEAPLVSKLRVTEYEAEGPEELSEVLDYVANVIVELDKRNREVRRDLGSTETEDPLTRNLRLNLLALAKRAPLDTIARLPMDLVPEHIRHFVPTLTS